MSKAARLELMKKIEAARGSRVIAYVTSTRSNLEVQMAMDQVRRIYDHLRGFGAGARPKIDLFIHSNGGEGIVPWRLVTLIREHAEEFRVLVPFRAFSAATLTALGADAVVMHPMGMLGPTDPTVANDFNPRNPANPQERLGISVEDVTAYIALIKEDAGIQHEDELVMAFNKLAEQVHPLALGNVKRSLSQSRMMAEKLLKLHMKVPDDEHRIGEIVDSLTSKLYFHGHPINRTEAKEHVGLGTVQSPPPAVEAAMWDLYLDYEGEMKMDSRFEVAQEFVAAFPALAPGKGGKTPSKTAKLAYIESTERTDVFSMDYELSGEKQQNGATNVTMVITRRGWSTE